MEQIDKNDRDLRIVVHVNDAYPELVADLRKTPPRLRAERFRHLAALGVNFSYLASTSSPQAFVGANEGKATSEQENTANHLATEKRSNLSRDDQAPAQQPVKASAVTKSFLQNLKPKQ